MAFDEGNFHVNFSSDNGTLTLTDSGHPHGHRSITISLPIQAGHGRDEVAIRRSFRKAARKALADALAALSPASVHSEDEPPHEEPNP